MQHACHVSCTIHSHRLSCLHSWLMCWGFIWMLQQQQDQHSRRWTAVLSRAVCSAITLQQLLHALIAVVDVRVRRACLLVPIRFNSIPIQSNWRTPLCSVSVPPAAALMSSVCPVRACNNSLVCIVDDVVLHSSLAHPVLLCGDFSKGRNWHVDGWPGQYDSSRSKA
jgi:hypothetical protein